MWIVTELEPLELPGGAMNAGYRYGLFLSVILIPLMFFRENPVLMAFVWMAIAIQLAIAASLVWSRMRAGRVAAGMLRFRHIPDWRAGRHSGEHGEVRDA